MLFLYSTSIILNSFPFAIWWDATIKYEDVL